MGKQTREVGGEHLSSIDELEHLAAQIIELKQSVLPRRPIVIEFCGSPKAGKSSSIASLAMFLRRNGFRATVISERGAVCPIVNKFDPNFNIWAGCSELMRFAEIMSNESKNFDVVIMDRGFFDAVCWFYWQSKLQKLDDDLLERFANFFLAPRWTSWINILYIFKAMPEVCLNREYANLLTRKHGTIMNPDILDSFNNAIDECKSIYGVHFGKKLKTIDTSYKGQNEVNYEVTKDILDTLNDMIVEKIGYFSSIYLDGVTDMVFSPKLIFDRVRKLGYSKRGDIEDEEDVVQPIPVAVVTDANIQKIVVAKKLKKATSVDSPERRRSLIYFGGHVREEDELNPFPDGGVASVFRAALSRELKEELNIIYSSQEMPKFCIWDRTNRRSKKHVAIVYHAKLDIQSLKVVADRMEFAERGADVIGVSELGEHKTNFEKWSRIIIEKLIDERAI